jgi:hypothetical protein
VQLVNEKTLQGVISKRYSISSRTRSTGLGGELHEEEIRWAGTSDARDFLYCICYYRHSPVALRVSIRLLFISSWMLVLRSFDHEVFCNSRFTKREMATRS